MSLRLEPLSALPAQIPPAAKTNPVHNHLAALSLSVLQKSCSKAQSMPELVGFPLVPLGAKLASHRLQLTRAGG